MKRAVAVGDVAAFDLDHDRAPVRDEHDDIDFHIAELWISESEPMKNDRVIRELLTQCLDYHSL